MRDYAFGNLIARLRTGQGLSQFQLGRLAGVSDKAVSKWENGSAKPRIATCCRLAEILGVSLDELLTTAGYAGSGRAESPPQEGGEAEETRSAREDRAPEKRVELHIHTGMTAMDGIRTADAFVERIAGWGQDAVAITDFGAVNGFPLAFRAAKKHHVKLIPGCGMRLLPDAGSAAEDGFEVILLARNREGLVSLNRLVTLGYMEYFRGVPCIPREVLQRNRENLLIGSSCENGEVIRALRDGKEEDELAGIAVFYDYLEVQPAENETGGPGQEDEEETGALQDRIRETIRLGEKTGIPVAAVSNARYPDPEDALFRAILQYNAGQAGAERQPPYYVRTTQEMLDCFRFLEKEKAREIVIGAPRRISERIENNIPLFPNHADGTALWLPEMPEAEREIREQAEQEARRLYGGALPEPVSRRLRDEMAAISAQKSWPVYAIARMAAGQAEADGWPSAVRRTMASSLVAYLCGITGINPLPPHLRCPSCGASFFDADALADQTGADLPEKPCPRCGKIMRGDGYNLPCEAWFGLRGEKKPEIRLSVPEEEQDAIRARIGERFGTDHVFRRGSVYLQSLPDEKACVRGYAADHGFPSVRQAIARPGRGLVGMAQAPGARGGDLIIVPQSRDIHEFTPIQKPLDDPESAFAVTHDDCQDLPDLFLKISLDSYEAGAMLRILRERTGVRPEDLPLNDDRVLSLFRTPEAMGVTADGILSGTGTAGLPEFGSRAAQRVLLDLQPRTVGQVIWASGCLHGINAWIENAGELLRKGLITAADCPAAAEDVFTRLTAQGAARETAFRIMESVRRGKELTDEMKECMRRAGISEWYIGAHQKIMHLFPRTHAVSRALDDLRLAWFKLTHPQAFYAAWLKAHLDDLEPGDLGLDAGRLRQAILAIRSGNETFAWEIRGADAPQNGADETALQILTEMKARGIPLVPSASVSLEEGFAADGDRVLFSRALNRFIV